MSVVLPVTDYPKLSNTNLSCTCAHNAGETYARMVKPKCFECTMSIAREDKTLPVFHSCVHFFRIIFLKCKIITHQRLYFFFKKKTHNILLCTITPTTFVLEKESTNYLLVSLTKIFSIMLFL